MIVLIYLGGHIWPRWRSLWDRMVSAWQPALVLGGRGLFNPYAVAIFCLAIVGLAVTRGISDFDPLPIWTALRRRDRPWRAVVLMVFFAFVAVIPALLVGTIGIDIGRQIFGEVNLSAEAAATFPGNRLQSFFLLLAGAGIAEEIPYRLVAVSLLWWLTGRPWLAIVGGAVLFGAYHLTPLNSMVEIF